MLLHRPLKTDFLGGKGVKSHWYGIEGYYPLTTFGMWIIRFSVYMPTVAVIEVVFGFLNGDNLDLILRFLLNYPMMKNEVQLHILYMSYELPYDA